MNDSIKIEASDNEGNRNKNKEIDELKERLLNQDKQIALLMETLLKQSQGQGQSSHSGKDTVKIVHLVQRAPGLTTHIELSNLVISMEDFGEERSLTLQQFEELIGKYRRWFNSGMLSIAKGYEDLASRYGLKTAKDYPIDSHFIQNLGVVDMIELENIFPKLPESGQDFLLGYWRRKAIEGDPLFKDIRKIETLNRVSGGMLDQLVLDIKNEKIRADIEKNKIAK